MRRKYFAAIITTILAVVLLVFPAFAEENPEQYGYDETPAEEVTVTVTLSSDGIPLMGNDANNTILAHLNVTVPYFDLGLYGLEEFYRYHTKDGRGKYIDNEVVERPTAMHLMIYLTERYYMGLPEEQCCQGTSGILEYNTPCVMKNMYGEKAYDATKKAYVLTGTATSTYMQYLWGHDENLMYYRNHLFPLMSPGYGSTSDYQLLSDGNTFDLAMFTNWDFHYSGAFCRFDKEEYETVTGKLTGFSTLYASSNWEQSGSFSPISGLRTEVYDENWNLVGVSESEKSGFEFTFNQPGTYRIIGRDINGGTNKANKAPATAVVHVADAFLNFPFDRIADNEGNVLSSIETYDDFPWFKIYHVKVPYGTEQVNIFWKDLENTDLAQKSWDFKAMEIHDEENAFTREDDKISTDPSKWVLGENALLLVNNENNYYAAFTFEYYTPEHYNFAPSLKTGILSVNNVSIREHKEYKLKMSDLFMDPDGDEMTYSVSIDGEAPVAIDNEYSYDTGTPGSHVLVFTPCDSKGLEGETYTVNLHVTENVFPGYLDPGKQEETVSIRNFEGADLDLLTVFSDFDGDDMTFRMSVDGGEFESFTPEHTQTYVNLNVTGYWVDHLWFRYRPEEGAEPQTHVYRFMASDEYGEGSDVYTFTVNVVENKAPAPKQAEVTAYCMLNHYYGLDSWEFFKDPEGDKMVSHEVSINGGDRIPSDREYYISGSNSHMILIEKNEPYTMQFFVTDQYGAEGTCMVTIYPIPEVTHDVEISDNSFLPSKDGKVIYDLNNGMPATWITRFDLSKKVTLRGVKYSEYNGDYNYYLDIDDYGTTEDGTFSLTMRSQPSGEGPYLRPSLISTSLDTVNGDKTCGMTWYYTYIREDNDYYVNGPHYQRYRFFVNMVDAGDTAPAELTLENKDDGLYAGELADRFLVKCRFDDGITRYINDYTLSDERFDTPGTHKLTVNACGLSKEEEISVKEVTSGMAIVNDLGKYGRVRFVKLTDNSGKDIEGASLTLSGPVLDPDYDDAKYDGSLMYDVPNMLRNAYDIQIRLPMEYTGDSVQVSFELLRDTDYSNEYIEGEQVENLKNPEREDLTTGILTIPLSNGQGEDTANWFDGNGIAAFRWHAYDAFHVSVRTGACEIIGKVSSWDALDNVQFLAYPSDMTDEEIRADAMGEAGASHSSEGEASVCKSLTISAETGEIAEAGARFKQSFKVEGLDAGTYKLAVVKPGKYLVAVVEAEIDGTADLGTIDLRLFGDINNDGKVRAGDATQICRYIAGNRSLSDEEFLAADVNLDGKVRSGDATQICRYVAGNPSSFDNLK